MPPVRQDAGFKAFVEDQLGELRGVVCRAMFGGYGMYQGRKFFGIIYRSRLYFKTSQATRGRYEAAGMKPFKPSAKQTLKNYYEVPADVIENPDDLVAWAQDAIESGSRS